MIDRFTPIDDLPETLRVDEVARWLDCGRSAVYDLIRAKRLPSIRIGRLVRVPREALVAFVEGARRSTGAGEVQTDRR